MPIYEFSCSSCGHEFEKIVSFSAIDTPDCPACESDVVTRLLGKPAIHFKGSGWYITDSKKSNGKASTSNSETSETGETSDKSTKTESTSTSESTVTTEAATSTKTESSESSKSSKSKDVGDKASAKPKS